MNTNFSLSEFHNELKSSLLESTKEIRKEWIAIILENNIEIKSFFDLLKSDHKIAIRFLWFLSEIGLTNQEKLLSELPILFKEYENLHPRYKTSFASFWYLVGVPQENEGKAIDLLFHWLLSNQTNVTTKSRSLSVLFKLTQKYPELKNELVFSLKDQMHKCTKSFEKKANKILIEMSKTEE